MRHIGSMYNIELSFLKTTSIPETVPAAARRDLFNLKDVEIKRITIYNPVIVRICKRWPLLDFYVFFFCKLYNTSQLL